MLVPYRALKAALTRAQAVPLENGGNRVSDDGFAYSLQMPILRPIQVPLEFAKATTENTMSLTIRLGANQPESNETLLAECDRIIAAFMVDEDFARIWDIPALRGRPTGNGYRLDFTVKERYS